MHRLTRSSPLVVVPSRHADVRTEMSLWMVPFKVCNYMFHWKREKFSYEICPLVTNCNSIVSELPMTFKSISARYWRQFLHDLTYANKVLPQWGGWAIFTLEDAPFVKNKRLFTLPLITKKPTGTVANCRSTISAALLPTKTRYRRTSSAWLSASVCTADVITSTAFVLWLSRACSNSMRSCWFCRRTLDEVGKLRRFA